jgi:hypothetical protein
MGVTAMGRTLIQMVAVGMILTGLSACASPEEIRAGDEAACRSDGFQPNTPDFAACLQRQSLARQYSAPPAAQYGPAGYGPGGAYGPGWYRW